MHPRRWNQTKGTPTNQSGILFMRIHLNNLLNIPVKFIHLRIVKYLSSHSLWLSSHLVVGSRESRGIGRYLLPRRMTIKRLSTPHSSIHMVWTLSRLGRISLEKPGYFAILQNNNSSKSTSTITGWATRKEASLPRFSVRFSDVLSFDSSGGGAMVMGLLLDIYAKLYEKAHHQRDMHIWMNANKKNLLRFLRGLFISYVNQRMIIAVLQTFIHTKFRKNNVNFGS